MISQGKVFPLLISTSRYKASHLYCLLFFIVIFVLRENLKPFLIFPKTKVTGKKSLSWIDNLETEQQNIRIAQGSLLF